MDDDEKIAALEDLFGAPEMERRVSNKERWIVFTSMFLFSLASLIITIVILFDLYHLIRRNS